MTDKGDLDSNVFLGLSKNKQVSPGDIPFRFHGDYSKKEVETLKNFMHSNFPHVNYGGERDKGVIIEYPPEMLCSHVEWKNILDTVFLPEWEIVDPKIRRKNKIIVRFVDELYDHKQKIASGGNGMTEKDEYWIRIPTIDKEHGEKDVENLTFVLMHEISESDFWSKTLPNDQEAEIKPEDETNAFKSEGPEYRNLLDEKVANRRALKAVKRIWPNVDWVNSEDIYEEDK